MSLQFGFFARLTWWEYSWDIMEPVTYFATYATSMAMFAYFVITRKVRGQYDSGIHGTQLNNQLSHAVRGFFLSAQESTRSYQQVGF